MNGWRRYPTCLLSPYPQMISFPRKGINRCNGFDMGLIETLSRRKGSETKKGGGKRFIAGGIKAKPSKELAPNPQSGPTFPLLVNRIVTGPGNGIQYGTGFVTIQVNGSMDRFAIICRFNS